MTAADDRLLRQANQRFQRLTALGCGQRGVAFDADTCALALAAFWSEVARVFP
jgi:hypothetical protein